MLVLCFGSLERWSEKCGLCFLAPSLARVRLFVFVAEFQRWEASYCLCIILNFLFQSVSLLLQVVTGCTKNISKIDVLRFLCDSERKQATEDVRFISLMLKGRHGPISAIWLSALRGGTYLIDGGRTERRETAAASGNSYAGKRHLACQVQRDWC